MAPQAVSKGSLILVTGTTGYIAAHVTQQLLEGGYKVRGTARDPESDKSQFLKDLFKQHGSNFEIVKAGDLEEDNVFDEAVKDVEGIIHIASPFHFNATDPYKDLINPAVKGTQSLLDSAHRNGQNVKHIVVTSSVAAIYGPAKTENYVYTEEDWNDKAVEEIEQDKGKKDFNKATAYRASKNAAERYAWKFQTEQNPRFGLSTINPSFVFGPVIHKVKDVESINTSVALLFKYFHDPAEIGLAGPTQQFVDVRNVAQAHIAAIERPEASGKRFILSQGPFTWQQVVDVLSKQYPERKAAQGGDGAGKYKVQYGTDNTQSRTVLGIDYIDLQKTVVDTIESLQQFW
ncbi:Ketoreductase [Taphrina deformans PYCC 5710]|uniref:Ketoreductase n=1 Tax=Taphrina deformans (strain PYCC 5710 / ATCC 11124 / CBS 356.35 / IMI 108563 / JCM 9778 / NBRC 8474) TaxID=1097556 RepID=R4X7H1_TAPDE|nr:Ketoreductase [Taphrina deformans PYCC 5710]|eukprot:CCG81033.1 Ketoreductase [Taphrina deformans PYCC 5710]